MADELSITELTDGTLVNKEWEGTGIFDVMIKAVNGNVEGQRQKGYITGEKYADVYLGSMQSVIAQSMQFLLQRDQVAAQIALVERQTKGFDDDAKQKLLKQTLDSWSVAYSVAQDANSIPDSIKVNSIDSVMKNAMDSLSITVSNDPIGEA